jgi:cysteine desulfurase
MQNVVLPQGADMIEHNICYFDNNATTRIAPEALDAMIPYLRDFYGNPSSAYSFGVRAAKALEEAREKVAALIGATPGEIVFTSCGTESNHTALESALATQPGKRHLLTTAVEHPAIIKHCESLQKQGVAVTFLPVDSAGALDLRLLEQSIRPDTAMVSVMWANNETGVIFPVDEIAAICRHRHVLFHTDATQAPGRLALDAPKAGVDFLTLSAHKLHAPKGTGLLYVRRRTKFQPYLAGGHQERGRRAGTENVAGIVGFGRAAELAMERLTDMDTRVRAMRDRLEKTILSTVPDTRRNGGEPRLPNTSNIAFDFVEAEGVLMALDQLGICASSGSACTTGSLNPSHVLSAMGIGPERAKGCVRFSLGYYNTQAEVDCVLAHLPQVIARLRAAAPDSAAARQPAMAAAGHH